MARYIGGRWEWPDLVDLEGEADAADAPARPPPSVILIEDDDPDDYDEGINRDDIQFADSRRPSPDGSEAAGEFLDMARADAFYPASPNLQPGDEKFDLRGRGISIPTHSKKSSLDHPNIESAADSSKRHIVSDVEDCLRRVIMLFPDIDHAHVRQMYDTDDNQYQPPSPMARFDSIVEKLLSDDNYPRQEKPRKKRKLDPTEEESEVKRWEGPNREVAPSILRNLMRDILKMEFPTIPKVYISEQLNAHKYLYQTYIHLAEALDNPQTHQFGKGRPSQIRDQDAETLARGSIWTALGDELVAARKRVDITRVKKRAEHDNLQRAMASGETAECQACFDDVPMNRQIFCNGEDPHFTCFECAERYIQSEVGQLRSNVLCTSGCGAGFLHSQLQQIPNKRLLEKLGQIQQEKDIRDAEIEDLEECPFCDFKAIVPPVQDDFEFRCANPECEKVSCRRCKGLSHIPRSCEDARGDHKLGKRHVIEEAMSTALIRSCNKCKTPFIKQDGCNKIKCSSCGNLQCYICSQSIKDYKHFEDGAPNRSTGTRCKLHDNNRKRDETEVKQAEHTARAKVLQENPDISEEDLNMQVSAATNTTDNLGPLGIELDRRLHYIHHDAGQLGQRVRAIRNHQLDLRWLDDPEQYRGNWAGLDLEPELPNLQFDGMMHAGGYERVPMPGMFGANWNNDALLPLNHRLQANYPAFPQPFIARLPPLQPPPLLQPLVHQQQYQLPMQNPPPPHANPPDRQLDYPPGPMPNFLLQMLVGQENGTRQFDRQNIGPGHQHQRQHQYQHQQQQYQNGRGYL